MSRVVYTNTPRIPLNRLFNPLHIICDLVRHRQLIAAFVTREFQVAHRGTYLGLAWSVVSPLIMLALFTFVFGHIFGGKFNPRANETPAEFALALFIGLGFFNAFSQSMGAASGLILVNAPYVKTLAFPLEVLSVSSVLNVLLNFGVVLSICIVAHLAIYGHLHWTSLWLIPLVLCVALAGLGISWILSALTVFVRDIPAIITPITTVLMFISGVFFPLSIMSPRVRGLLEINPLAIIIDQARAALMYGNAPDLPKLAYVFLCAIVIAVGGYAVFQKTKPAFADVL
jgi:lipopolysaccharide transport system permease protein